MYKVKIDKIHLYGYHGVYDVEKKVGQMFHIDVEYHLNSNVLNNKDNLEDIIDYTDIIKSINVIFNKKRYNLIETLAQNIINELVYLYKLEYIKVAITKDVSNLSTPIKNITVELDNKNE